MVGKKAKIAIICLCVFIMVAIAIITPLLCIWFDMPILENGVRIVAYVKGESANNLNFDEIDFSNLTHVIYTFARVRQGTYEIEIDNPECLRELSQILNSKYPSVSLMLSIGNTYNDDGLCKATRTEQNLNALIDSCKRAYKEYDLDGFDIDWEYPKLKSEQIDSCKFCTKDHARLIRGLKDNLQEGSLISFTAGVRFLCFAYDNNSLKDVVDFVNVMNYDFSANRNSPFSESKINTFNYLIEGYSKEQINWGLPFYNRCDNSEYDYYQYYQIVRLAKEGSAQIVEDNDCTYAIYKDNKMSFDSYNMVKKKVEYVKKHGYGGVFCWHLEGDMDGELLPMIYDILK